jgi:hypothetical protein
MFAGTGKELASFFFFFVQLKAKGRLIWTSVQHQVLVRGCFDGDRVKNQSVAHL